MDVLGGHGLAPWIAFNALVIVLLAFDLGVVNRKAHAIGFREALFWNIVWTALGVAFAAVVFRLYGRQSALEYLTGYVIERALSIDNIFVFVIVFSYFRVDPRYQHRVLFWGILGALVMRGALIFAGAALVALFHWVLYLFGAFLVYSGVMLTIKDPEAPEPDRNPVVRLVRRLLPLDTSAEGPRFFVRRGGRLCATPLLILTIFRKYEAWIWSITAFVAIRVICSYPGFHSATLYASRRERLLYAPVAVAAVVAVVSNIAFTLRWGVSGAIVAYALTQIAVAGGTMVVAQWARRQASASP